MSTDDAAAISVEPGSVEDLNARLLSGDAAAIVSFFSGLTEKERRAFVKPLREQLKSVHWRVYSETGRYRDWNTFREIQRRVARTQIPAALAVLGGPSTIAKHLRTIQRQLGLELDREAIRQALADRDPDWLAELPDAFAETLDPQGGLRSLIEIAAEQAGVVPAASPGFVRAWAIQYQWGPSGPEAKAAFLAEPRLAELLPLTFDDDENDDLFTDWSAFRKAAVEAVQQGLVPRDAVLDGGIRRMLRGGRIGAMQGQLSFWAALEPTDREIADRISSCISLLSSQNGTVARVFLAAVKQICDTGLVDLEPALEAASIAVTRSEKNVVKTALGWLDALATKHPERTAEIAGHIATAFGAQGADVQERAVKLIGKRAKRLSEADRQRLAAEAEVYLAPDLAAALAGLLGVEQDSVLGDVGYPDVAPYVPRPLLPPIASPSELAETVAALMHGDPTEAMVFERVLEAFVAFSRTDAAGLREALTPVAERHHPSWGVDTYPQTPRVALYKLAEAVSGSNDVARRHGHRARVHQLWPRVRKQKYGYGSVRTRTSPSDFLILRAAEIHAALGLPDLPPLVSMPTAANGIIAPDVLAARLRECESKGWVPLEADFHQALLRLPVDCRDLDVSDFTSKAGQRFAAWVAGDRVDLPVLEMPDPLERERVRDGSRDYRDQLMKRQARTHVSHPDTLLELLPGVWTEPERQYDGTHWDVCWPAILPAHPDLPAVALAGGADWTTADPSPESAIILAELDDPVHAGTHHVIACRMVDPEAPLRASGVDAALLLASRGLLDPARLADTLATRLLAEPGAALKRMVPCLRDLANGGAAGQTWGTVAALLPRILPPALPKAPAGTGELLVLGTELAGALKVRVPIDAVTAVAEKKGGSAVANAARRLQGVLVAAK